MNKLLIVLLAVCLFSVVSARTFVKRDASASDKVDDLDSIGKKFWEEVSNLLKQLDDSSMPDKRNFNDVNDATNKAVWAQYDTLVEKYIEKSNNLIKQSIASMKTEVIKKNDATIKLARTPVKGDALVGVDAQFDTLDEKFNEEINNLIKQINDSNKNSNDVNDAANKRFHNMDEVWAQFDIISDKYLEDNSNIMRQLFDSIKPEAFKKNSYDVNKAAHTFVKRDAPVADDLQAHLDRFNDKITKSSNYFSKTVADAFNDFINAGNEAMNSIQEAWKPAEDA